MTNKPLITRDDLYVTVDFQYNAEVRLMKHFAEFVRIEHKKRGEEASPRFANKSARDLISVMLSNLHMTAENELCSINSGECEELPEWSDDDLATHIADAQEWYRWMLENGNVKLPKPRPSAPAVPVTRVVPRPDAVKFL